MNETKRSKAGQYDAVIVGAGVSGILMLYKLRQQGLKVIVIDGGEGPGGTWHWNRYPGARFDSESYTYGYSFSQELLEEWDWSEHFAGQPETLRYLNYVVDRFDLRQYMQFGLTMESAAYQLPTNSWELNLSDGCTLKTRFLCTALGMLSAATLPNIPGRQSFAGPAFHTYYWPHEPVQLAGKRVAVIGTGSTGVQVISEIADKVDSLTAFQRHPNWCAPLHNSSISKTEMQQIRSRYQEIFDLCRSTPSGFLHGPDRRALADVPVEERRAFWEALYASPGFGIWHGNFRDVLVEPAANAEFGAFMAEKIRQRVHDPVTAEKLIPRDHGFGMRRVPLETRYYEAYNHDHVRLVNVNDTPIERIVPEGIQTTEELHEFDLIVYATGFDAITGSYDRIEITGRNGLKLADKWRDGPVTYLGTQVHGFPNLFILAGPQSASVSTNFPRAIESSVEWTANFVAYLNQHGIETVEATREAERAWCEHIKDGFDRSLLPLTKSWFTGYNSNVKGHETMRYMVYLFGAPAFRKRLADVAAHDYTGFHMQ